MRFMVELEPGEDGWIIASCPSLPGCHTQGRDRTEALERAKEAIQAWLEAEELEAASAASQVNHEVVTVEVAA